MFNLPFRVQRSEGSRFRVLGSKVLGSKVLGSGFMDLVK
jgi:hypothetical protein